MYCPFAKGMCQKNDCVMYHVDAEKCCVLFAYLYRIAMWGVKSDM